MSHQVSPVRGGSRRASGFTLVDVMIALMVIAIGVLGMMSLLLLLKARNESFNSTRHAVRACQEVLELSLAESRVLSTTSVNSKALIALISQWADAAPRTGEASSWHRV